MLDIHGPQQSPRIHKMPHFGQHQTPCSGGCILPGASTSPDLQAIFQGCSGPLCRFVQLRVRVATLNASTSVALYLEVVFCTYRAGSTYPFDRTTGHACLPSIASHASSGPTVPCTQFDTPNRPMSRTAAFLQCMVPKQAMRNWRYGSQELALFSP